MNLVLNLVTFPRGNFSRRMFYSTKFSAIGYLVIFPALMFDLKDHEANLSRKTYSESSQTSKMGRFAKGRDGHAVNYFVKAS